MAGREEGRGGREGGGKEEQRGSGEKDGEKGRRKEREVEVSDYCVLHTKHDTNVCLVGVSVCLSGGSECNMEWHMMRVT